VPGADVTDGELYVRQHRQEVEAVNDLPSLTVLSSQNHGAADSVLRDLPPDVLTIYTRFDAELLASGASSLSCLQYGQSNYLSSDHLSVVADGPTSFPSDRLWSEDRPFPRRKH